MGGCVRACVRACVLSNDSKFVKDNSNYITRFFYNCPRCLPQHKNLKQE